LIVERQSSVQKIILASEFSFSELTPKLVEDSRNSSAILGAQRQSATIYPRFGRRQFDISFFQDFFKIRCILKYFFSRFGGSTKEEEQRTLCGMK